MQFVTVVSRVNSTNQMLCGMNDVIHCIRSNHGDLQIYGGSTRAKIQNDTRSRFDTVVVEYRLRVTTWVADLFQIKDIMHTCSIKFFN